ncbi:MAG: beta-glucosidase [Microgenomates group bacterium Gr01-1014_7]|nr:MAG: beta-glucosidase [Microgenomates group bacterium Gr01-1014_7]
MPTPKPKHEHGILKFPKDFLWGAATSAYQVEGNNVNADWWAWEQKLPPKFRSGKTCNQYELYEKDFALIKELNHNAHRLSIEWSRIEPKDGEFDHHEIEHYVSVLKYLKSLNIKVMLTLWHFTLPQWVAGLGGWENSKTASYFERFVKRVAPEIAEYVDFWITLNEPGVYVYEAYFERVWPPAKKSFWGQIKTTLNLASAHKKVYKYLHSAFPKKPVGIAQNVQSFEPYHKHSLIEQVAVVFTDLTANHLFYFLTRKTHDFLGINYYFHTRFKDGKGFWPEIADETLQSRDISDLGWEVYPEGLFDVLADLSDDLPIYITECGIASTNDDRKNRFLITYLSEVYRAIKAGIQVKGFFYWSLIDNFEWHRGFDPRFGLVEVDYLTFERKIRPSALVYTDIIQHSGIPHSLLRFIGHTVDAEEVLEKRYREIIKENK